MLIHSSQLPLDKKVWIPGVEEMFLYAAWCIGLTPGDVIHRHEIFSFIQTNVENKGEENLQGTIEKSIYWENKKGSGEYELKNFAKSAMSYHWGTNYEPVKRHPVTRLWRNFQGKKFSIEINAIRRRLFPYLDDTRMSGVSIIKYLDRLGVCYKVNSSSSTSKFWNWVIQDNDYYWYL